MSAAALEPSNLSRSNDEIRAALRRFWPYFAMAGAFSSAVNLLYLSSPLYLMQVYNRVLVNESIPTLVLLTLLLAAALLTMAALDAVRAQILVRIGDLFDARLAGRVFAALVARSAQRGGSNGAQQLRQLDDFRTFITGPGVYFMFDLPWIPIYLILLFLIHPLLGAVATVGAAALLALAALNEVLTRDALRTAENSGAQSYVFTENILRHADVVAAMGMQSAVERHWRINRAAMISEQGGASDRNAVMSSAIRFARLLLQALMLGVGAWLAIDHAIMPATIFAASIVMGRALVPVEQAVATWRQFVNVRDGYRNVRSLLAETPASEGRTVAPLEKNAIEARDVAFEIPGRKSKVLKNISFDIGGGQAIGVVGPSGSGKSTLARLLVGAAPASDGELTFGGVNYESWEAAQFGRKVGYLPQDVGLFLGSVRDNIARFGDASIEEIITAAKLAGIHDMILSLPKQYDTMLGPGGVGLSGGQRQRLGLARALLGRPALLVLDEPNANLDAAGEAALKAALVALKAAGVTIIVITHRPTILEIVDRLMLIRSGEIERYGPPQMVLDHLRSSLAAQNSTMV